MKTELKNIGAWGRMHYDFLYRRNRHFINGSSMCICYLSREDSGTEKTVCVARKEGLQIINIAEKA